MLVNTKYVGYNFCVSHKEALAELVKDLEKQCDCDLMMTDYQSCNLAVLEDGGAAQIRQLYLITKFQWGMSSNFWN